MQSKAQNVEDYIKQCPEDQAAYFNKLRQIIVDNIPKGFEECMNYGMIGYVVPHSLYPAGYHCTPELPLPFAGLAYQKNSINFYHMGLYTDPALTQWFQEQYKLLCKRKLDMGKSCVRFKNYDDIPYNLIGELVSKITPQEYIKIYEGNFKKAK